MKKQVLLRWLWCVLEYLMVCPVILIITGFILAEDDVIPFILVLPVHMLVSILITSLLRKFRNLLAAGIGVVYIAGVTWLWQAFFMSGTIEEILVTIIGTAFFFIWGIRAGIGTHSREFFFYTAGLLIHVVSLFFLSNAPRLLPLQQFGIMMSIIYVLVGLPLANRRFLINETLQKSSLHIIPGTVSRGNTIIVFIVLAGIILLSFWRALLDAVLYVAGIVADFFKMIMEWLASFNQPVEGEGGGGSGQMALPPADDPNPTLSLILDILSILVVLIIVFFIVRYFVKNYKRIYAALYDFFSQIFGNVKRWSATEQGYVDRQESLLKSEAPKRLSFLKRLFRREPKWKDMKDNASRVRFLYTRFVRERMKQGFVFSPSETPDETVNRIRDMEKRKAAGYNSAKSMVNQEETGHSGALGAEGAASYISAPEKEKDGAGNHNSREKEEAAKHNGIRDAYNQVRYGEKDIDDATVTVLKDIYLN